MTHGVGSRLARWYFMELAKWCSAFGARGPALKFYGYALSAAPDDPRVLAAIAFELAQSGRMREALARFDRAAELAPDWAEVQFDRGFLLQQLNDHEAALAAFDHALARNPDHDRALYGKALSLISLARKDEAVAPLERNTKLQPMSPYGWYQLARVQFDRGKPEKTQAIIDHLATFEPKVAAQLARETGLVRPPAP
jgi:tetratricopeptide (TPR) repeat protein